MDTKLNYREPIYVLIILALIAGIFWYGKHEGRKQEQLKQENLFLMERVKELEAARDTAISQATQERTHRDLIVQTSNLAQNDLKAEIKRLKARRVKIPVPELTIDSSAVSVDLVDCDSIITIQDVLIQSLETESISVTASYEKELTLKDEALEAQKQIAEVWRKGAESNAKQLRKSNRWRKFWRNLGIGALSAAVVIGVTQ